MTMDPELPEKQEEILSILEEQFPNLPPRDDIISVLQETQISAQGLSIEQMMLKDLKELSDGEIKVAVSTVDMTLEDCLFHSNITSDLKAFTDKFGFDVLILIASHTSEEQQRQQIAVYSQNLELCSQICCELEESQNPCLELEPFECGCDEILVYQQEDPSVSCDQVFLLVKEVINRRCAEMVSNSRTSSTEAVAGSAPLSQGSSGIMELYGSDVEPQPCSVNFIDNPPELSDSNQAQADVNIDLVSPDSGLATIRSSRSSKESSVFLSDDSPVGEGAGPHHSLLPGFDSYSPIPEGVVAEEHARSGEHGEHFDLFNFDPAPMASEQSQPSSHSADYSPEDDFPNSDFSEGNLSAGPKGLGEMGISMSNYSSSSLLSEAGKDSLVEFDEEFVQRQESSGDNSERNLSLTCFVGDEPSSPERLKNIGKRIPPTPMNSFVEVSPSTEEPSPIYPEDIIQNVTDTGHLGPPQTRARCRSWWGGLEIESKNIEDAWSSSEQEAVFQSPGPWKDHKPGPVEKRAPESTFQTKSLGFPEADPWESEFGQPELGSKDTQDEKEESLEYQHPPTERPHLTDASPQGTNHLIEDFAALWHSSHSPTTMPEPWGNPTDAVKAPVMVSFPTWGAFDKEDNADTLKNTWNLHPTNNEVPSVQDPSEWALAQSEFSFPAADLLDNSLTEVNEDAVPEVWGKKSNGSKDNIHTSGSPVSDLGQTWNNAKLPGEGQSGMDPKATGKVYEKEGSWNLFEESVTKRGSDVLAPWEDSFLSYKCSDYSASNIGEDSVPSPLDTNYSTSDSYTSPTYAGDEKETENKPFAKEDGFETKDAEFPKEGAEILATSPQQPQRNRIGSGPGNLDMWASPHTEDEPEGNDAHHPVKNLLKIEHAEDENTSIEDDAGESSPSSYDDPSMMRLYNEANRQLTLLHSNTNSRQTAPDSLDTWNRVILEDTQSTATISDMDNDLDWDDCSGGVAISGDGQAEGYGAANPEPETRFSVKQLEPWGTEHQEANQADWDLSASAEPTGDTNPSEYHILNEKSGQLIANSIWDSVMRDKDMSSFRLPSPPNTAEQSPWPAGSPRLSVNGKDGHMLEASGLGESAVLASQPDSQDTWTESQGDTASSVTRMESPEHFAQSDSWTGYTYGQSETEGLAASGSVHLDKEAVVGSGVDATSLISRKESTDQELSSAAFEHREIFSASGVIRSPSVTSSPQTEEQKEAFDIEKEPSSEKEPYNLFALQAETSTGDFQAQEMHEECLTDHSNSGEANTTSGSIINLLKNIPVSEMELEKPEDCNILEPERASEKLLYESPQTFGVWDGPVDSDVWDSHISYEAATTPAGDTTKNRSLEALSPGNYDRDSLSSEYTHSSASSPGLNDSSAALLSWTHGPSNEHQKDYPDDRNKQNHQESELLGTEAQVGVITEMKDLAINRKDGFGKMSDYEEPKLLEIPSDSANGDSSSSSSSLGTDKYSEQAHACQEGNLMINYQGENELDSVEIVQPEDTRDISTSLGSGEDSEGEEELLEKELHLATGQAAQSKSGAFETLHEPEFLAEGHPESEFSVFAGSSEPTEKENRANPFCDSQQSSPAQWILSPLMQMGTQDMSMQKEPRAEETGTMGDGSWQVSPGAEPKNGEPAKSDLLSFSADSSEWWNAPPRAGRPTAAASAELSNSESEGETTPPVFQNAGPWGVPVQHGREPGDTGSTNPFCDSDGGTPQEKLWNIQPKQLDSDANQFSQLVILDHIKDEDSRQQTAVSSAAGDLPPETPTQEQCRESTLSSWDHAEPASTHRDENEYVSTRASPAECYQENWWEQERPYFSQVTHSSPATENLPAVSAPIQPIKKSGSEWDRPGPSEPRHNFVPDILHGSFEEGGQRASASPDLWMDVKQPFAFEADAENPDLLTHCDHDSNTQASDSPDLCHDSEGKQETEKHSDVDLGPEVEASELYLTEPKANADPPEEPGLECVPPGPEVCAAQAMPLPPLNSQTGTNSSAKPNSSTHSPEPSHMYEDDNTSLASLEEGAHPGVEVVDGMTPGTGNVDTDTFETQHEVSIEGNGSWVSEDLCPGSHRGTTALLGCEQPFASESPAVLTDVLLASDTCLDVSEAAFDHSFSDASGLNTSTGTIDDMSKLTLSEGRSGTPVDDGDAAKQDICSSEASWGDFECDVMGQNIDEDLMKEPEHFLYGGDLPLEEGALKQSLAPYTPPFDLSYLTEPAGGAETAQEAGSPDDASLGSDAAEMLLSALPDHGEESQTEANSRQPRRQMTVLHIHEDPEALSSPVGGTGSNPESSPSNNDWELETDNSDLPAGGDGRPPNGKEILELEEEKVIPTTGPEQTKLEYKDDKQAEKIEGHQSLPVDYILVSREKDLPLKPEAWEARENAAELEQLSVGSGETELPETPLAGVSNTCQPGSLNDVKVCSAETISSRHKRASLQSPTQDWLVLGHSEAGDPSAGSRTSGPGSPGRTVEQCLSLSSDKGPQSQVPGRNKPVDSLALEEVAGLSSQSRKSKRPGQADLDEVPTQAAACENEWEMLSPQLSQKNRIPPQEAEEETEFLEPGPRKPRPDGPLSEDVGMDIRFEEGVLSPTAADMRPEPPNSLDLNGGHPRRIKLTAPNINLSLDQSEGSILSDDNLDSPDEIDINVDELDTPDEADSFEYPGHEDPMANQSSGQESESIPEYTAEEEREDNRLWRTVVIGEQEQRIDMKVIEPYRRVISHGGDSGYYGDGLNAIIVFAACFLPDSSRADYHYVMENLFLYVISTLELMVAEDYMIVYLNGATPRRKMPGLGWMKKCYQMIDRRLRKNLKSFIIVHPSWFIRTILAVTRPFISSKFSSKIKYVTSLSELSGLIPMDCIHIPESIIKYDEERSFKRSVRLDEELREASEAANIDMKLKEKP